MAAYEDHISIPKFYGINQASDDHNTDLKYANGGLNFNTEYGGFKPYLKSRQIDIGEHHTSDEGQLYDTTGENVTLAFFTKRWETGAMGIPYQVNRAYAVAICNHKIYIRSADLSAFGNAEPFDGTNWYLVYDYETIEPPEFMGNSFSCIQYEMNYYPPTAFTEELKQSIADGTAEGDYYAFDADDFDYYKIEVSGDDATYTKIDGTVVPVEIGSKCRRSSPDAPIDCLLISNNVDGMYCVFSPVFGSANEVYITRIKVRPEIVESEETEEPEEIDRNKFGTIERYCERIFGAGILSDPDKVMYSAPHDVFNWEQYNAIPEDGAGDIQQPNWDGDGFVDLQVHGNSLLCIKKHAIWKIQGSDPSQFVFKKQYGEGAISTGSVQTNGVYTYMLSENSIKVFDGSSCYDLMHGSLKDYLSGISLNYDKRDLSAVLNNCYYLITDKYSDGLRKRYLIIFNTSENTYNVCDALQTINVDNFDETYEIVGLASYDNKLYALVRHGNDDKIDLHIMFAGDKSLPVSWESAWIDLNARNINKSSFSVYMMLEREDGEISEGWGEDAIDATVSIITEKKTKTKTVALKMRKQKRIQINNQGRMFKLRIEFPSNVLKDSTKTRPNFRIATGIQIYLEYDYD